MGKTTQSKVKGIPDDKIPEAETWVDFRGKEPVINIQVKRNEDLVKKRNEILKKYNFSKEFKGLYIFFIDGLSRANFFRLYRTNFDYLQKFYNNKD